jgi:hypothetical protein
VSKNVVDAKFLFSDVSEEASNSTCPKTISHLSTQISIHHIRDSGAKRLPREMDVQDMNQDQWSKSFDYGDEHAERFSLWRPNMYFLICKIGIFEMTISKQFLQLSCLDAQIPQQKLPPRLHNNVCFLSQRNAGFLSLDDPPKPSTFPQRLSHSWLYYQPPAVCRLRVPVEPRITTIAAHQGHTASARSTGTGLA